MAGGLCGHVLVPATTARTFLSPQKKIHGAANGVSGVLRGCPQEQGALTGQAWKLRLLRGMTRSQGPPHGPSATASTSATRRQVPPLVVAAEAILSRLPPCLLGGPRRVSMDMT